MVSRREFLERAAGAGAALVLAPELLRAHEQSTGTLIQRSIRTSGEKLPGISFGPRPTAPPAPGPFKPMPTDFPAAREVLKTFIDNGGKVVLHGGPIGEQAARTAAEELGIQNKFFWTTPSVTIPNTGGSFGPGAVPKADPAVVRARLEEKFAQLKAPKTDLVMVSSLADAPDAPPRPQGDAEGGACSVRRRASPRLASNGHGQAALRRARGDHAQRADRLRRN